MYLHLLHANLSNETLHERLNFTFSSLSSIDRFEVSAVSSISAYFILSSFLPNGVTECRNCFDAELPSWEIFDGSDSVGAAGADVFARKGKSYNPE